MIIIIRKKNVNIKTGRNFSLQKYSFNFCIINEMAGPILVMWRPKSIPKTAVETVMLPATNSDIFFW